MQLGFPVVTDSKLLGDAWSEFPPRSHREALTTAFDSLCDGFFDDPTEARDRTWSVSLTLTFVEG
jgi:hypothetical protein